MAEMGFNLSSKTLPGVTVPLDEFKHALFIGKTGNGKTTGGINPLMDSRIKAGYGMLVFDEKGKEHRVVKSIASHHGRLGDVVELGKPHGIKVNLLSRLSERQMESFIRRLLKRSDESYWTESSVNMAMALIRWLVAIKKLYVFGIETFGMESIDLMETYTDPKTSVTHEWGLSFEPLSAKELSGYFHNSTAFAMVSQLGDAYVNKLVKHILNSIQIKHTQNKALQQMILMGEALIDELHELQIILKGKIIKADLSEASGNNGSYFMLSSILNVIGANPYVNDPMASDLSALLSQGKIVVVHTESFSTPILSTLLDQTLESLSTRSKQKRIHPISVIIDEANRVLSADSDIRIDVLRESKVEIIMATQNHEQMLTKMGGERWLSFAQNFNTRLHFMGAGAKGKFKVLDELSDRELEAVPMFFDDNELDLIEWEYQQQQLFGYYSRYIYNKETKIIALYDHTLMENENKILLYDLDTHEMRTITLLPDASRIKSRVFREHCEQMKAAKILGMAG